jgi:hypothetical protein
VFLQHHLINNRFSSSSPYCNIFSIISMKLFEMRIAASIMERI